MAICFFKILNNSNKKHFCINRDNFKVLSLFLCAMVRVGGRDLGKIFVLRITEIL